MLRHIGAKRTYQHNLRLAIFLSLAAGFVNAAGWVAFGTLTTNVTGHVAFFSLDLTAENFRGMRMAALYFFLFLAGAFFSGLYTRLMGTHRRFVYTVPLLIELFILCYVALYGYLYDGSLAKQGYFAGSLLLAMGIQNALVTVVSRSVVRTTHLTGIMTDFGIALADAVREKFKLRKILRQRLLLHISIIFFFLLGGVAGAFSFLHFQYFAFFIPGAIILFTVFFDAFRMQILLVRHRIYLLRRRRAWAKRRLQS